MTAQARNTILAQMAVVSTAMVLVFPSTSRAVASVQTCTASNACVIGEYLYDDNYALETTGTCTITAKNPDLTAYLTNQAMTHTNGWYAYSFTAATTTGYYPTQVCCTVGSDTMCMDKSFQVAAATTSLTTSDISAAVWGYSGRTLSGFGDLVSNIWGHSGRNVDVNNLGTVVRDVWTYTTRTLTGEAETTTATTTVVNQLNEIATNLEKLVNAPIIENSIEDEEQELGAKLLETDTNLSQLYLDHELALSQTGLIGLQWSALNTDEAVVTITDVEGRIAKAIGRIEWLQKAWGWAELKSLTNSMKLAQTKMASVRTHLETGSKSTVAFSDLRVALKNLESAEKGIGNSRDKYDKIKELASVWDAKQQQVEKLLATWKTVDEQSAKSQSDDLYQEIMRFNKVPQASVALTNKLKDISMAKRTKNKVLGMRGLVLANRQLLAKSSTTSMTNTWLEEGSVIFKTLVTNPSTLVSQTVQIKYYLPAEVKEEDIIDHDSRVQIKFDPEKNQLYAQGNIEVAAGKSETVSVRVQDNWIVSETEINSLKNQVSELSKPLEKTAFFAQGVTLSSDINASLDKTLALQEAAVTPEQKIRAFREAKIEMNSAETKLVNLQNLVTQAGSTGSLLGFVGGAQVMAVWSLVIIGLAGFVFLALYMRKLSGSPIAVTEEIPNSHVPKRQHPYKWILHSILITTISSATTAAIAWQVLAKTTKVEPQVLSAAVEVMPTPALAKGGPEIVQVSLPGSQKIEAIKLGEKGTQTQVEINGFVQWVDSEYVQGPTVEERVQSKAEVVIGETETGWLRVRNTPQGKEIARVQSGETYVLISQQSGWLQIELEDGSVGWLTAKYAEVR